MERHGKMGARSHSRESVDFRTFDHITTSPEQYQSPGFLEHLMSLEGEQDHPTAVKYFAAQIVLPWYERREEAHSRSENERNTQEGVCLMSKSRHHHSHQREEQQQHRQHREEKARKHHEEWQKKQREAKARAPRLVRALSTTRGGITVWGTRRVKPPSPMKVEMEKIELLPPTPSWQQEMRHTRMIALAIIVLAAIVVAVTGYFFLLAGH